VVLDPTTLEIKSSNLVLAGTLRNCAGGISPWGWLSCEESVAAGHGYVFACRTDAARVQRAEPIRAYGRFNHEAACVDPPTAVAYLTEDRVDGCFYRFVPTDPARPFDGKLQALRVAGAQRLDTSRVRPGEKLAVDWVDVLDPDPPKDNVRHQAQELGAAVFRRGEGAWFFEDAAYFVCTTGGAAFAGQIFKVSTETAGRPSVLELVAEARKNDQMDCPDNITFTRWGDAIVAEDGSGEQLVRGITPDGRFYDIARNARSSGEIAGVCMSPDGRTLLLNRRSTA
jgi:secreted PhoX family phosphatase